MNSTNNYYTNVYVYTKNNKNILAEIITEIGKKNSIVKSCNTKEIDDNLIYELNIRINDRAHLEEVINGIEKMPNVIKVTQKI